MYDNCSTFIASSLTRSHFDHAVTVWDPFNFIDDIESVQRRATVLIPEIKNLMQLPRKIAEIGSTNSGV